MTDCRFPEHMTAMKLLRQIAMPYRSIRASARPAGVTDAIALFDRLDLGEHNQWCPVCKSYHADPGVRTDAGALVRPCPAIPSHDPRNIAENFAP